MRQIAPLLESRFRFQAPALAWPRARLYEDHLELTGWRLLQRYRRRVSLRRVLCADAEEGRLVLWLDTGEAVRLELAGAREWQAAIEAALAPGGPPRHRGSR